MSATRHTSLETVLRRDRALVLASLVGVAALASLYLVKLALRMAEGDTSLMGMGRMGAMDGTQWDGITFALMFVMWLVMMMGMMAPSATPTTSAKHPRRMLPSCTSRTWKFKTNME